MTPELPPLSPGLKTDGRLRIDRCLVGSTYLQRTLEATAVLSAITKERLLEPCTSTSNVGIKGSTNIETMFLIFFFFLNFNQQFLYRPKDGPKNTSVSVRPSTEVDRGTDFTLTCSCQANPTTEQYIWFKVTVEKTVEVETKPVLVSSVGGDFFCRASNKHGSQKSAVVSLKINGE